MKSVPVSSWSGSTTQKFSQKTTNISTVTGGTPGRSQHFRWNSNLKPNQKLPLTHFISIPIGHHPGIQSKWSQVTRSFLNASPAIPGLDQSVIIKPGGLHVTLGVMSLRTDEEGSRRITKKQQSQDVDSSRNTQLHSVQDALALLRTLREPIRELINDGSSLESRLYLPLDRLDIMRNGRNNHSDNAHVLWVGPDLDGELGKRFRRVCELVHSTFKEAGYLQDLRPLKLHCTLINTVYRKQVPRSSFTLSDAIPGAPPEEHSSSSRRQQHRHHRERIPFSYQSILSSTAYREISVSDSGAAPATSGPCKIDLGAWPVDEIQICRMGSQDGHGVYKSVGGISLQ